MDVDKTVTRATWLAAFLCGGPVLLLSDDDQYEYEKSFRRHEPSLAVDPLQFKILEEFPEWGHDEWWDGYGGYGKFSRELCTRLHEDISQGVTIDWEKTKELTEDSQSKFVGTYQDSKNIPIMRGVLYLSNGNYYPWVSNLNINLSGLKAVLNFISKWEKKTDVEVLEKLKEKLEEALTGRHLEYTLSRWTE